MLDTSFLAGTYNAADAHHEAAWPCFLELAGGRWGRAILLEYVFLEMLSVLLQRAGRTAAQEAGRELLAAEQTVFVPCSKLWDSAWGNFQAQTFTKLSLTDIAVAQYALEHAEGRVLGFDQEFRKVPGIRLLPATR